MDILTDAIAMFSVLSTPKMLGDAIAARRKTLGLTQAKAAARVGLNQKTFSNIENFPEKSSIETLYKVMSALELECQLHVRGVGYAIADADY